MGVEMSTQISPHAEATLAEEAQKQGISVDALLGLLISERQQALRPRQPGSELPAWDLGPVGAMHRREIYEVVS
jgi:hypothetical protein